MVELQHVDEAIELVNDFPNNPPTLKEVTFRWRVSSPFHIVNYLRLNMVELGSEFKHLTLEKLEHALLRFSQARFMCLFVDPVCTDSLSFWTRELGKHLPVLFERGAVSMESKEGELQCFFLASRDKMIMFTVLSSMRHDAGVDALAISPDGKWLASGAGDSTIILWDTSDGMVLRRWIAHNYQPVLTLAFSPDTRYLVSCGKDRKAVIWDLRDGASKAAVLDLDSTVLTCAWSPDGKTIATGFQDGSARLWDAQTFPLRRIRDKFQPFERGVVCCLAYSPNGQWLAFRSSHGEHCILNVALDTLHKFPQRNLPSERQNHLHHLAVVYVFPGVTAFHPKILPRLRLVSEDDRRTTIMDSKTGTVLFSWEASELDPTEDISFSPDGTLMLRFGAPRSSNSLAMGTIHLWDPSTGIALLQLEGHTDMVHKVRFSPCGKYIATASDDGTVRLWRTGDGSCAATFSEHKGWVRHIAFSPDCKTLSSAAEDGTVVSRALVLLADDESARSASLDTTSQVAGAMIMIDKLNPDVSKTQIKPNADSEHPLFESRHNPKKQSPRLLSGGHSNPTSIPLRPWHSQGIKCVKYRR